MGLYILLLPDSYLKKFTDSFTPFSHEGDLFFTFLHTKKRELQISALQNPSFRTYINEGAIDDARKHLQHIRNFKTSDKTITLTKQEVFAINVQFEALQRKCPPNSFSFTCFIHKNRKGMSTGFIIGCATTSILLILKVIDVLSFGLNLPLTIILTASICLIPSLVLGLIGATIENRLNLDEPQSINHKLA